MATVYAKVNGKTRTATETQEVSHNPGGSPVCVTFEYEASALATATIIDCVTIPAYSEYWLELINHDAMGPATSLIGGVDGAPSQNLASVSTVSAGVAPSNTGVSKQTDNAVNFILTTTGTMTGTIQGRVWYKRRALPLTF